MGPEFVLDAYDALLSQRPYRLAWPIKAAATYLQDKAGKDCDPQVVEALVALQVADALQRCEAAAEVLKTERTNTRH